MYKSVHINICVYVIHESISVSVCRYEINKSSRCFALVIFTIATFTQFDTPAPGNDILVV